MRPAISTVLAFVLSAGLLTGGEARAQSVKVAVAPFAPLTGEVPVRAGGKGAMLLAGELKNLGTVTPIELATERNEAAAAALQVARDAVTEAQALEKRRKFGAAAASYRKAIDSYDAAAPLLTDVTELSDAHVALGIVHYLTGNDVEGARELSHAIALTPARRFAGEATSPLFAATVKKLREQVLSAARGALRIESMPPGMQVLLDDKEVGRTPLTLKNVPPGKHVWRVLVPSSEPAGGAVMIEGGKTIQVATTLGGDSPVSRLNAILSRNRLDEAALAEAKQVLADTGADLLVFGALLARGEDMALETFLYSATQDALVRLPARQFDTEMLSAGMELFHVAGEIGGRVAQLGSPEQTPCQISLAVPPPAAAQVTEVAYALPGDGEEKVEERKGPRRPVDPHKTRRQLRERDK
jgi:hypothetical protein